MISLSWSGEKYLRPASIEIIFLFASFSFTWLARSVLGAATAGVTASFFFSEEVLSAGVSAGAGLSFSAVGVEVAFSVTTGALDSSAFGATVRGASWSSLTSSFTGSSAFSSNFSGTLESTVSLTAWGLSWIVWTVSSAVGAGVIPSADTTWVPKANPMSTEAAPTAYLRMEKRCFFSSFMIKPPCYYIVW